MGEGRRKGSVKKKSVEDRGREKEGGGRKRNGKGRGWKEGGSNKCRRMGEGGRERKREEGGRKGGNEVHTHRRCCIGRCTVRTVIIQTDTNSITLEGLLAPV